MEPVEQAIIDKDINTLYSLVESGANITDTLVHAIKVGDLEIVKYLVENGARYYNESTDDLCTSVGRDHRTSVGVAPIPSPHECRSNFERVY